MALGKVRRSCSLKLNHGFDGEESRVRFVRCNSGLGRKRIAISRDLEEEEAFTFPLGFDSPAKLPSFKRHCSERIESIMMIDDDDDDRNGKSALESLPQDVLIRIICGVEHEDLKQLFNVSKSIRETTMIAKRMHFAYSTPSKVKAFRDSIHFEEGPSEFDDAVEEEEAPNAPRQRRFRRSINKKKLAEISVALFS